MFKIQILGFLVLQVRVGWLGGEGNVPSALRHTKLRQPKLEIYPIERGPSPQHERSCLPPQARAWHPPQRSATPSPPASQRVQQLPYLLHLQRHAGCFQTLDVIEYARTQEPSSPTVPCNIGKPLSVELLKCKVPIGEQFLLERQAYIPSLGTPQAPYARFDEDGLGFCMPLGQGGLWFVADGLRTFVTPPASHAGFLPGTSMPLRRLRDVLRSSACRWSRRR